MNKEDAWAWRQDCCSQDGKVIVQFEVMEGPERGKKLYKGKITINVKSKATVMTELGPREQEQVQKVPFEFEFPEGKGLKWCKSNFDEQASEAVKKWTASQKQAKNEKKKEKSQEIAVPDKKILGPGGRPLG